MSEEIVRRLRSRSKSSISFLKESLHSISEAGDDEEEKLVPGEDSSGEEAEVGEPEVGNDIGSTPEDSEDYVDPDGDTEEDNEEEEESNEYINPLDNPYAVKHTIDDEVVLAYSNGTNSKLKGVIDGYDKEGFYRILWSNGLTTNGITDLALSDIVQSTKESTCVCGSSKFVNESGHVICDECGRRIRESDDPLTKADKSRPAGKKLIRSEAHPITASAKPSIDDIIKEAIKGFNNSKSCRESVDSPYFKLLKEKLAGEFWTRRDELVNDIEELDYEVVEINGEYVIVLAVDEEDEEHEIQIPIVGTSRTMTLDFDKAREV